MHHLLFTQSGTRISSNHKLAQIIRAPYIRGREHASRSTQREPRPADWLRETFSTDVWHGILREVFESAEHALLEDFSFLDDFLVDEAKESFDQTERGLCRGRLVH